MHRTTCKFGRSAPPGTKFHNTVTSSTVRPFISKVELSIRRVTCVIENLQAVVKAQCVESVLLYSRRVYSLMFLDLHQISQVENVCDFRFSHMKFLN